MTWRDGWVVVKESVREFSADDVLSQATASPSR
jgi:hypothetical protein